MEIDKVVFTPNASGVDVHANKKGTINIYFKNGVVFYYVSIFVSSKGQISLSYPRFYIRNSTSYPVIKLPKSVEKDIAEAARPYVITTEKDAKAS